MINLIKKVGLEKAISISAREDNKNWLCPSCKSPVIITGQKEYETLSEHVSNPNLDSYPQRDAYQCSDENCITKKNDIFWSYMGERYGVINNTFHDDHFFINKNDAPFGSSQRKYNVEIYKKGLKDSIFLPNFLFFNQLKAFIEIDYVSNTNGDVLKRKFRLKFIKKNGTLLIGAVSMWKYLHRKFLMHINNYKETGDVDYLKQAFEPSKNKAWVFRWYNKFIKIFWRKLYLKIKKS